MFRLLMPVMVLASVAAAQPAEAPPAAAEPELVAPPPPPAEAPGPALADRTATKERFSRFSAGRGGPLFAFAEGLDGLILSGLAGAGTATGGQLGTSGAFIGALAGGVVFGAGAAILQYVHPIGLSSAGTMALGLGVGALAGFGIATAATVTSFTLASLLALAVSQLGMLVPLIALWSVEDIPGEDLALMGMTSTYAFVLTALTSFLFTTIPSSTRTAAVLIAPAIGMALGSLWAHAVDLNPGRVLKLTALPLGVGLVTFILGAVLTQLNLPIMSAATLLTTVTTFGLTYFLTGDEPAAAPAVSLSPTLSMVTVGSRNEAMAVGPALVGRF
ncbi:MAG: hypothetical protein JNM69_18505 [Archangium sp.]|nr:hypothetical protein [Archangium sp.]